MALDITLLRICRTKDKYEFYSPLIKDHLIDDHTRVLLRDFQVYYKEFPELEEINIDVFWTWFKQLRHPNIKSKELQFYNKIVQQLSDDTTAEQEEQIKTGLNDIHLATVVGNMSQDMTDGRCTGDVYVQKVIAATDKHQEIKAKYSKAPWDDQDVLETIEDMSYESGLKFRLGCLDKALGSLHPGKLFLIAAYVDSGKGTFLTSEGSFFAEQTKELNKWYSDRPIVYFNNEGSSKEIKIYFMQSALDTSYDNLLAEPQRAREAYRNKIGDLNRIQVIPCQGWHINELETVIKNSDPCVVIYDMVDNIRGFEEDQREDQRFRELYDKIRQMTVKYNHLGIGTSQCTGEAEGLEIIPMSKLSGSRVAKQSTADCIITIGRSLQSNKQDCRFLYAPKNKLRLHDKTADRGINTEVIFDGENKRYRDPGE